MNEPCRPRRGERYAACDAAMEGKELPGVACLLDK